MGSPLMRRSFVLLVSAIVVSVVAYSQLRSERTDRAETAEQSFGVEVSSLFITVRNQSGRTLQDVIVSVEPVGRAAAFTMRHGRLEVEERRDFPVNGFRANDGTPLNLRVQRPRSVTVTAQSWDGEAFETTVPWR